MTLFRLTGFRAVLRQLDHLVARIKTLEDTMSTLDDLKASVDKQSTVIGSVITLLQGINDRLASSAGDQAKIDSIMAEIDSETAALAAAVTANTPAGTTGASTSTDQPAAQPAGT